MMTHQPNVEGVALQPAQPDRSGQREHAPEQHTVISEKQPPPAGQGPRADLCCVRDGGVRRHASDIAADLVREGANMLALQMRQSGCLNPLVLSSKAAQALLKQF